MTGFGEHLRREYAVAAEEFVSAVGLAQQSRIAAQKATINLAFAEDRANEAHRRVQEAVGNTVSPTATALAASLGAAHRAHRDAQAALTEAIARIGDVAAALAGCATRAEKAGRITPGI